MKKVALVFVLAVILPSLVLAWLAVRSLRDQQFLLERQQSLLDQRVTDSVAQTISDYLAQRQQEFASQVENLVGDGNAREMASQFDNEIRRRWPLAEVGFCVTLSGKILSPLPNARSEAQSFYFDNKDFLGNREAVEVYGAQNSLVAKNDTLNYAQNGVGRFQTASGSTFDGRTRGQPQSQEPAATLALTAPPAAALPSSALDKLAFDDATKKLPEAEAKTETPALGAAGGAVAVKGNALPASSDSLVLNAPQQKSLKQQLRKVSPQVVDYEALKDNSDEAQQNLSKVIPSEAEFAQLIGNQTDGMLARFLQNKLKLMFWHRPSHEPDLVFGAQLNLNRIVDDLCNLIQPDPALRNEICIALLDDNAKPVALSRKGFSANWKRPFVATEIGDALPHWEVAAYLVDPTALTQTACFINIVLGLLIAVLVLAIVVGSWLIVRNLNYELTLARQKTDFVSNVSHELKTPLTSIRMFSELLAENRVADHAKRRSYLQIITAEAARLTRLINNVLDFSRMERGEKKYNFQPCDLGEIVRSICDTFRPHLETSGFQFHCELPETKIPVRADADALSQVIVNLLSNAEKYSNGGKEIEIRIAQKQTPLPHAEIQVLDRGSGVPRGSEEKIFEKFYRAHDSLSSGIQGSGLGLTIARQIARAHGGDVIYERRDGGGSCFALRLPLTGEPK